MGEISRRAFVGGVAGLAAGLTLVGQESAARGAPGFEGFPGGIELRRSVYSNWDGVIVTDPLWTAAPRSGNDVVRIANWAKSNGYTLRPKGYAHSWSPATVDPGTRSSRRIILVDTTVHLTGMASVPGNRVRVQTGASMESLLAFMHARGLAMISAPAPGDVSVGGVLAVNGHGTAVPARGERVTPGTSFGTVSNAVTSANAVVWNATSNRFEEKRFDRSHPDMAALLTNLGRSMLTEVELLGVADYTLRCTNRTDIHVDALFAEPASAGPTSLSSLLDDVGRVGLIWYAFTDYPWVQIWDRARVKPATSRETSGPFNYPFADRMPDQVEQLLSQVISGNQRATPAFSHAIWNATATGLSAAGARDMWGPAKDFIHFVRPTTLRVTAGSHVVTTRRADVQWVVSEFAAVYRKLLAEYAGRGRYPINSCVEIRVTGIDDPNTIGVSGAVAPDLSAAAPVPGHADWDTAVWLDTLTLPATEGHAAFYADLERRFFQRIPRSRGCVRVEWAKRWGHGPGGAWSDPVTLDHLIPDSLPGFAHAAEVFDRHDPHGVFNAPLWNRLRH